MQSLLKISCAENSTVVVNFSFGETANARASLIVRTALQVIPYSQVLKKQKIKFKTNKN
jgi:hypothetical protein